MESTWSATLKVSGMGGRKQIFHQISCLAYDSTSMHSRLIASSLFYMEANSLLLYMLGYIHNQCPTINDKGIVSDEGVKMFAMQSCTANIAPAKILHVVLPYGCYYHIVQIISPWAIYLHQLWTGGGLIIPTELIIIRTYHIYASYTYTRTLSWEEGGLIVHHGLIIRTIVRYASTKLKLAKYFHNRNAYCYCEIPPPPHPHTHTGAQNK